ncbi:hypothetical protein [Spongiivirga citrea]|uniref:Membrane or secreted protein n=1 Tax=Spongiivirga citrea TaxID=1481457 RepID=A0A6M0CQU5_9FLAO|nr:hypothetical protein [Spongiivirga citrea]NER18239.1 hypothetical protein [Spongiivirga citrea]
MQFKKYFVLGSLFILPLVVYLFFLSGVNNFYKLPVLSSQVSELDNFNGLSAEKITLDTHISILGFLGKDAFEQRGLAFNLNEKIYKPFYQFKDFQFVMVLPKGTEDAANKILTELGQYGDTSRWKFVFGADEAITSFFSSLKTDQVLDNNLACSKIFIIDKERNLRGRNDDEDVGTLYGYNPNSIEELGDKMKDDVKIVLAEYRLALKKNSANRKK